MFAAAVISRLLVFSADFADCARWERVGHQWPGGNSVSLFANGAAGDTNGSPGPVVLGR
jgi:hypothetical protein